MLLLSGVAATVCGLTLLVSLGPVPGPASLRSAAGGPGVGDVDNWVSASGLDPLAGFDPKPGSGSASNSGTTPDPGSAQKAGTPTSSSGASSSEVSASSPTTVMTLGHSSAGARSGDSGKAESSSATGVKSDRPTSGASDDQGAASAKPTATKSATTPAAPVKAASTAPKVGLLAGSDFPEGRGRTVSLQSPVNGKYVAVEANYPGNHVSLLRARADSESAWERFTLVWVASRKGWALRSNLNGLYASAELKDPAPDTGMLRARASSASDWELFSLYRFDDGTYGFKLQATGAFVSAELHYGTNSGVNEYGMMRARAGTAKHWERFRMRF